MGACQTNDSPSEPPHGDASLTGSVTSEKTSAGIHGLPVVLIQDDVAQAVALTDSAGTFRFTGLARGEYRVHLTGLEVIGMSPKHTVFTPTDAEVLITGGSETVFFAAVGVIPPRVVGTVSCGGAVAANAQVRVIGGSATDTTVVTNDQGKYGATGLDPGRYAVVLVSAPCAVPPTVTSVLLLPGQAATVDFAG